MINLVFSLIVELENASSQNSKNYLVIEKNENIISYFIQNFTKTYKKPSIPTLLEVRNAIDSLNSSLDKYLKVKDTLKIDEILPNIGKFKLYDLQIIYILAYLSYNFDLKFEIYCAVKCSKSFKDYTLFDMGVLYGISNYACYPILAIDDYYLIGPRKMYVLSRISDFERFPNELFSIEVPQLQNQMSGYKIKLLKAKKIS